jgi:hypothetical protein
MNWLITFTIGIIVGQEFNSIPRIKPILQDGFQRVVEYSNSIKQQEQEEKYESFWSIPTIFKLYNPEEQEEKEK